MKSMIPISNPHLLISLCGLYITLPTTSLSPSSYPYFTCSRLPQTPALSRVTTSLHLVALSQSSSFINSINSTECTGNIHNQNDHKTPLLVNSKANSFPKSKNRKRRPQKHIKWLKWLGYKCDEIPVGQLPPNVLKDFQPVMNIYAKERSRAGAENAEYLLQRILKESDAGNTAVENTMTTAIFNVAIDAWAKSGVKEAGERAEGILSWMNQVEKQGKHMNVRQDTISFTSVIDAWANSNIKGSANKACAILDLMEKMSEKKVIDNHDVKTSLGNPPRPNRVTYNACLSALARSRERNSATKAEKLVERMERLYKENNNDVAIKPDVVSYQSLIFAWANSREWGAPQRAEEILKYMDDLHKAGDKSLRPNAYCFAAAINAWSKSVEKDKVERAWNMLKYMQRLYDSGDIDEGPNVFTYTSVMNTACYPCIQGNKKEVREAKENAFEVADSVFNEMKESDNVSPNHVTYGTFLNACHRLLAESDLRRKTVIEETFRQAVLEGQVGSVVLRRLLWAAGPDDFRRLVIKNTGGEEREKLRIEIGCEINIEELSEVIPDEWSRNVEGEKPIQLNFQNNEASKSSRYDTPLNTRGIKVLNMRGKSGFYSK